MPPEERTGGARLVFDSARSPTLVPVHCPSPTQDRRGLELSDWGNNAGPQGTRRENLGEPKAHRLSASSPATPGPNDIPTPIAWGAARGDVIVIVLLQVVARRSP